MDMTEVDEILQGVERVDRETFCSLSSRASHETDGQETQDEKKEILLYSASD